MLRITFLYLVFFMMSVSVKAVTLKEETTSLFDDYLVLHHEKPFKDVCKKGVNFYRLVSGGGQAAYELEDYLSVLKDDDRQLAAYGNAQGDDGARWEYTLDDSDWKKINTLFQTFDYKTFQKEDPLGAVFDVGLYRMEICQNGHPFIYYRYDWNPDDKKSNRSKSMSLTSKYRSIFYKFYRKHKRNAKYISITEETRLRKIEEEHERERKEKESRDKAHRKYIKELQEKLWKSATTGAVGGINYFKNVNANIKNAEGETPLMVAVKNGHTDVVRSLDVAIVNVREKDYAGKTAFDYIKIPTRREEAMYSRRMYGALRTLEIYQIIRGKAKMPQYSYKNDTDLLQITIKGAKCEDFTFPKQTQCQALKPGSKHEIFKAIKAKDNALFDALLPTVKDMTIKNKSNYTLLWASIHYHNFYALEKLLDAGANMYAFDQNGLKTPVFWATMINDAKLLNVLLKHGVDVNSKDMFGSVALSNAMYKCSSFDTIEILLEHGANPYLKDKHGKTIFDKEPVFCKDKKNIEKMKKLLHSRDSKGLKAQAVELNAKAKKDYLKEAEILKKKRFDTYLSTLSNLNSIDAEGFTPLHKAVATKDYYAMTKLIEKGADINMLDGKYGVWTPFNYTIAMNDVKALKIFLDHGADINFYHEGKSTVLNDAIRICNLMLIKFLLDNGANPRLKDGYGGTVESSLKKCDKKVKEEVTKLVNNVEIKGTNNTLQTVEKVEFKAAIEKRKNKDKIEKLQAYVKAKKNTNNPIFETIKYKNNRDFDKYLKTLDNIDLKDDQGNTLLYMAVEERNYYAMKKLLAHGANMNYINDYRTYSPFSYAVGLSDARAVKLFLDAGVNVNYQYKKNLTSLSLAVKQCAIDIIKLLLNSGADITLEDKRGDNAVKSLGYCNKRDNKIIADLILKKKRKFLNYNIYKADFKGAKKLARELSDGK